jgi:hypothetical protein
MPVEQQQRAAQLPPNVIAEFLAAQQGTAIEYDDASAPLSQQQQQQRRRRRRALPRWLRRILLTGAGAGLVAAGAVLGRALHAQYMATLDDRDALARERDVLASRVGALSRSLEQAHGQIATAEAATALQREALEGCTARCASLSAEAQEVARLNRALQLRLEKAESKLEQATAARADAEARVAAARAEATAANDAAATWEKEAVAATERMRQADARADGLVKVNAALRAAAAASK